MLDFDNLCSREVPSVAAMVYPFSGNHKQKFYWGHKEIMIPGESLDYTHTPHLEFGTVFSSHTIQITNTNV